jgi:GMP synthase (glutamine-hydrolysing)
MKIHYLQHVPFEPPGAIERWAEARGHTMAGTRLYRGELPPVAREYDRLVVMGGPMSVGDEIKHPWLVAGKRAIADAVENNKSVIGVCLGAQLIADVLGAKVYNNRFTEIGWYPVTLTPAAAEYPIAGDLPDEFMAFHWHGDTFDIPRGAAHIARSEACANQMFVYGDRVVGVQFHLEVTEESLAALVDNCEEEIVDEPFIQPAGDMLAAKSRLHAAHATLNSLLDRIP